MRIGQIVFVDDTRIPQVQTGIIVRKEYDPEGLHNWYEVLCNDDQNHVLPEFLLSPAHHVFTVKNKKHKNIMKNCAMQYKNNPHLITLYT